MKYKCKKCKCDAEGGCIITEAGDINRFCINCTEKLERLPTGNTVHHFLSEKEENWVAKNIREAKEKRDKGQSPWNNNAGNRN